ncbi:MAG: hypothetical protein CMH22_05990 [Methylophaga sp.]|nr:hypothetical protein [Methylophaga sp.]|tara:strand:+ start:63663 stop:64397 length:735 start_codon:yes stop_codon:yes gene_type:complete
METIIYKGIEIEVKREEYSENPFEEWDGCVPLMYEGGRNWEGDFSKGDIIDYLRNYLSYNQVKRHQSRLLDLMGEDVEEFKEDYPLEDYDRTEMIKDDILYSWLDESIDNKTAFCEEFNIKHYSGASRGYSQGDYAEVFMCWTPEFGKITGRTYESMNDETFECNFELFEAWAWGDVYYYTIEETGDSCGGFYGDNHRKSGLLEYAEDSIDCYLEDKKKQKENKLKTLVKNNVPLNKREQLLQV